MKIPFLGGAYEGRSSNVSAQQCINLYYEPTPKHELNDGSLVATPGALNKVSGTDAESTPTLADDNQNEVRASIVYDDPARGRRVFFVIKNILYEFTAGVLTERQTAGAADLTSFTGRLSLSANAAGDLMISDGSKGYIVASGSNIMQEITDAEFVQSDMVVHQDGYFILAEPSSNRFRWSDPLNGLSWQGTSQASAEGSDDQVVALLSDRRELWVFGERTTEVFYNNGDADDPWQRFQNGFVETGIAAKWSAAKFDNSVVWLSKNNRGEAQVVRAGDSWLPVVISTPEINYQIQNYSKIDDAFAYAYQMEGHEFYVITFPTANVTWAYDALTQEWHQRGHTIMNEISRERYNTHLFFDGQHLMGDYQNGRIYSLDSDTGIIEKDGAGTSEPIQRVRTSPASFTDNEKRIRCSEFQLDMEEGINDAHVWLSYSKNGGHTFTNETNRSIGAIGKYATRIIWRKLGFGRNWIFRIRTWSTGKIIIKGAYARIYGESATES
jgi:hypothetical protein